jgi:hypothetical protein
MEAVALERSLGQLCHILEREDAAVATAQLLTAGDGDKAQETGRGGAGGGVSRSQETTP